MKPADKTAAVNAGLEKMAPGRMAAIVGDCCVPAPMGCGKPAKSFRDMLSLKEFSISGLCQECQDSIFACDEEETDEFDDRIDEYLDKHNLRG